MKTTLRRGGGMLLITAHLLAFPVVAQDAPAIPSLYLTARGALDEFDCVLVLLPTQVEEHERFALGDAHGFLHVYEQREQAYQEVWISETFESGIAGLFVADVNLDDLDGEIAFCDAMRAHGSSHFFNRQVELCVGQRPSITIFL